MKVPKNVEQSFVDGIESATIDRLKAVIVELQVSQAENDAFKESEEYQQEVERYKLARERFNETAGPVKELSKALKAKTNLVVERLKEKGGC